MNKFKVLIFTIFVNVLLYCFLINYKYAVNNGSSQSFMFDKTEKNNSISGHKLTFGSIDINQTNIEPNGSMIIISATHYKNSTFHDPNTLAILFTAERFISLKQKWYCVSKNKTGIEMASSASPRNAYQPIDECLWTTFIAKCVTVSNPIEIRLQASPKAEKTVIVPFESAINERLPVVGCFSPLFFNERWQLIGLSIESYAAAGVSRQAYYVMSALKGVHDLLTIYEINNRRLVDLYYWTLPPHPEARLQLDWRDQASAHIDCYLKHRQAADFVIISDIDDLLFPRYGQTLFEEFSRLARKLPGVESFFYPRFDAEIFSQSNFTHFNPAKTLRQIRISNKETPGKSVHSTKEVESVWIHWADVKHYHELVQENNMFVHVRNWTFDIDPVEAQNTSMIKPHHKIFPTIHSIIPPDFIERLDEGFNQTFAQLENKTELMNLTTTAFYYDSIDYCYNEMLGSIVRHNKHPNIYESICPTPARCMMNRLKNVDCIVAQRNFDTIILTPNWKISTPVQKYNVKLEKNGCTFS